MSLELWDFALSGQWPTQQLAGNATAVAFSDDFNRANGAVDNGWTYTYGGPAQISSNAITTTTSAGLVRDLGSKDVDFSFDVTNANQANNIYFYLRSPAADSSLYYVTVASTSLTVTKRNRPTPGGSLTDTPIASVTGLGAGYNTGTNTWRLVMSGQSLQVYKGGVLALSTSALGADYAEMSTYFGVDLASAAPMTIDNFTSSAGGPRANVGGSLGVTHYQSLTNVPASITDSFNRADNAATPGSTDTGQAWITPSGAAAGISGNRIYGVGNTSNLRFTEVVETNSVDGTVQCTVYDEPGQIGLVWRADGNNNATMTCYYLWYNGLYKYVAGSSSLIASWPSGHLVTGDVIKAVFAGTSIKCYRNGSLDINTTDSSITSNTKHGVMLDPSSLQRVDDFSFVQGGAAAGQATVSVNTIKLLRSLSAGKTVPTVDTTTTAAIDNNTGIAALTWSHTCASGAKALVVSVGQNQSPNNVVGVTYGGTALTKIGSQDGPVGSVSMFLLKNPPSGAANIVATVAGPPSSGIVPCVATSYFNASGMGTAVGGDMPNFNNPVTITPSTSVGDLAVMGAYYRGSYTLGTGLVDDGHILTSLSPGADMAHKTATAGTTSVAISATSNGSVIAAALVGQYSVSGTATATGTLGKKVFLTASLVGQATVTPTIRKLVPVASAVTGSATVVVAMKRFIGLTNISQVDSPASVGGPNSLSLGSSPWAYDFTPSASMQVTQIDVGIVAVTPGAAWYRIGLSTTAVHDGAHSPATVPWLLRADATNAFGDVNPANPNAAQTLTVNFSSPVSLTAGTTYSIVVIQSATQGGAASGNNASSVSSGTTATYSGLTGGGPIYNGATLSTPLALQYGPHFTLHSFTPVAGTNGVGSASGVLRATRTIAASVAGQAVVSGIARLRNELTVAIAGVGTTTGATSVTKKFTGTISGSGLVTAATAVLRRLLASVAGIATTTSSTLVTRKLIGSSTGSGIASATTLTSLRPVFATVTGVATTSGVATSAKPLGGSTITGTSTVTPLLRVARGLVSTTITGVAHTYAQRIYTIPPADFQVTHSPPMHIAGVVYDTTGVGVGGATVKLFRQADDFMCQTTTSAGDGTYSFDRDPYDPYNYYVVAYTTVVSTQIHGTSDRGLVPV